MQNVQFGDIFQIGDIVLHVVDVNTKRTAVWASRDSEGMNQALYKVYTDKVGNYIRFPGTKIKAYQVQR